ncbi:MAG: rhomboid family intramembrane serine protease [Desulfuromonadales bacterium]
MFLPIGDVPNPKSTPYVNWALIGLNVAVFLAVTLPLSAQRPALDDPALLEYLKMIGARGNWPAQVIYQHVSAYDLLVFKYGFRPAEFSLVSMFTAMFLHGGAMHLAGNMLFLWIYGDNVEHRLGHLAYLVCYLAAGIAATLFFALFVPGSQVPMLGASGAISGVLGFYFLWFPHNRIKVFVFLFPLIMTTLLIPARIVLGIYLVIDNLLPFMVTPAEGSGVAHGAHIGGFLAGLGLAFAIDRLPGGGRLKAAIPKPPRQKVRSVNGVTDIVRALDQNDLTQAAARFKKLDSRDRLSTGNILAIGEHLLAQGETEDALTVFRRLIAERPGDPQLDQAYLGAGRAMFEKPGSETAAWHYLMAALDVARSPEVANAARRYMAMIEEAEKNNG